MIHNIELRRGDTLQFGFELLDNLNEPIDLSDHEVVFKFSQVPESEEDEDALEMSSENVDSVIEKVEVVQNTVSIVKNLPEELFRCYYSVKIKKNTIVQTVLTGRIIAPTKMQ